MKFSQRIAIDLGTANTLVWVAGQGLVANEPTVVAVSVEENRVVAVGNEAKRMLGRTPENLQALRPMRDGVIADYQVTEAMLRYFIAKVSPKFSLFRPEVMVCVPAGCTQVERRAVLDAALSAGARTAYLIDEPLAAAIGAKIPVSAPSGHMILDIGGGAAEAAVICLGGVVVHRSVRVGGNKIDETIAVYVRKKHNLIIGDQTAELIKIKIGSATRLVQEENIEVSGRDQVLGLPRTIILTSSEVTEAMRPALLSIIGAVKGVLEETPPELASDIIERGITMSGGTSSLRNFDRLMVQETGVPAHLAEEPLLCVVRGTGVALENLDLYRRSIARR
ncbi:MAG: rod shape-determining protein [Candidatus Blackburnbacteria bacterium RIFCSPHIGHO2_01_FULL_44_64]|uniref:Cell shape-determining protein MreB n=1 Tax=Candidatus Blackburnbacteria bacterium RIFCSPHIGHO2_02_FULL_44_20 TaxID=1797516 RepID=A0A1G1V503_9BACT|nr:MAG: rod shape-determining protein [Candidatus Blackburnbacteria bacterium RIFCSPHIGHO2_01_FULL_44_64]OGY10459.1 MAG: rod shape-determining protein [Candidatus Blackburnbacteria bacterium RIFCSPHIGHO2_02_FULL_44_20]OGY10695.1 MAG: rod shape-determining protein [Candidatus Blackburnbacteria bacterium RIFCSPHIGHO2_12_FULL_44_25]OGY13389.1 MAG: rod shape-determining protein [Candidatus Blackburnbacteria bacterium RIFCSPLOWO2_01_FULL_44_43]OGY15935.1 MAG: rod shape-determining protein [Candidatu